MKKNVAQMNDDALLKELEHELLPKLPSVEGGWRMLIDTFGLQLLAQTSTRLVHLALRQRDKIAKLEDEVAELKRQIARIVK